MILCRVDTIISRNFMKYKTLQFQYDKIYSYFKNTTEPFDFLDWDGRILKVWQDDTVIEIYTLKDLNLEYLFHVSNI